MAGHTLWVPVTLLLLDSWSFGKGTDVTLSPPHFSPYPDWPKSNYYDEDGPPITLECQLQAASQADILWYKDNVRLSSQPGQQMIEDHNQTLTLIDPKHHQTGVYKCVAQNKAGNVNYTGFIYIAERRQVPRPRVVLTHPDNAVQHATLGHPVNISCVFDVGGSQAALMDLTMIWYKNQSLVEDNNHTTWGIDVTPDNNQVFTLTLDQMQESDYGSYTCLGKNQKGNDSSILLILPPDPPSGKFPYVLVLGASVGGFVVIATVVMAVVVRQVRKKRKYEQLEWLEPDFENYNVPDYKLEYDVFVSYSSHDDEWVRTQLFNNLTQQKYKVCVDFKDFMPGMAISENIIDAIYKSRKILVLMSRNFLQSMWGQFELQQALNRAVLQRKDVLVVVKFDKCKVPTKLMGTTFLDWTDKNVKPHFWSRLAEALGEPADFELDVNEDDIVNKDETMNKDQTLNKDEILIKDDTVNKDQAIDIDEQRILKMNEMNKTMDIEDEGNKVIVDDGTNIGNELKKDLVEGKVKETYKVKKETAIHENGVRELGYNFHHDGNIQDVHSEDNFVEGGTGKECDENDNMKKEVNEYNGEGIQNDDSMEGYEDPTKDNLVNEGILAGARVYRDTEILV